MSDGNHPDPHRPRREPSAPPDPLARLATEIRARYAFVSTRDELTDAGSVINQAEPGEPVFVLRARDNVAHLTIDWWLWCARNRGVPAEKLARAEVQLRAVEMWLDKSVPSGSPNSSPPVVRTARSEVTDPASVLNTAHPDEPVFVLVASDAVAAEVVEFWAFMAARNGAALRKVESAIKVSQAMAAWGRKRIVGVDTRPLPDAEGAVATQDLPLLPRRHATVTRLVCRSCGYEETIGRPPYTDKLLATIAEACRGPCPNCGAKVQTDPESGRDILPLTTRMVTPEQDAATTGGAPG